MRVNWGLIGCGDISEKRVAPALRDLNNCNLIAVNRSRFNLAEPFAKKYGANKCYKSWQELLQDKNIDAVYIATPVYVHSEMAIAAAKASKHVLCEKPMAMNVNECDRMIETCKTNNVKLGIAYYRNFYPVVRRVKEIISSGEIGKVSCAQINIFEYFDRKPGEPRYWLVEKEKSGGGPMYDIGSHRLEVFLNIFGPVADVKGQISNVLFQRNVEDTGSALIMFESNVHGVLSVSHASKEYQDTLDIYGSEGSIHIPVLNKGDMIVKSKNAERNEAHPPHENFHLPLIDDFAKSILEERELVVDANVGREVNRLLSEIFSN
jgi:predicted dehydrogenase